MPAPLRLARAARTPAPGCLRDRVVLVTGAGGGLGRATALAAAQAGANVVLLGRKVRVLERLYDELEAHGGPTPAIYPLDLEEPRRATTRRWPIRSHVSSAASTASPIARRISTRCSRLARSSRWSGRARSMSTSPRRCG